MPPIKKPSAPAARPIVKSSPAQASSLVLPTSKTMPATSLRDYISLFFGPPGIGKTTFVNNFSDRVLIASTDRGTRFISAMRVECMSYEKFLELLTKLEAGGWKNYDYLCIDHVDDWANMIEAYVLKQLKVDTLADAAYGKGWSTLKKEVNRFMTRLKALGLGIVFIAHEDVKKVKVRGIEIDKCQPLMSKQAWNAIIPLADIVGYCGMKPVKDKDNKRIEIRVLETTPREDLYAKDRTTRKRPANRDWENLNGREFVSTFSKE